MAHVKAFADGRVSVGSVYRCHSIAECPWCAEEEAAKRADVVRSVVRNFERHGGGVVYFVTLTCRHAHGDNLRELRKALCDSWRDIWTGKVAAKAKHRLELDGFIRALDVTHGKNGWHPHLHVLMFCRRELSGRGMRRLESWLYHRWRKRWSKLGLLEPSRERAVRVERAGDPEGRYQSKKAGHKVSAKAAARYIVKMGLGREVTSAWEKEGRADGHRTAWRILADYVRHGRARDAGLWNDWCRAMRGARWLTWSKGLRARWQTEKPEAPKPEPLLAFYVAPVTWTTQSYQDLADALDRASDEALFRAECERDAIVSVKSAETDYCQPENPQI